MKKMLLLFALLLSAGMLFAQNKQVTGKVTDENGAAMAGVTVIATKSNQTFTKDDGTFSINVPANVKTLDFTYVGYGTQTIAIGDGNLSVRLSPATVVAGDSVVVTGYSRIKRSEFTGAASTVRAEKIAGVPMASFDQILQGRVPGLLVTAGSGQPGTAARVQLRGATSIEGGSTPLYVVDGIPVEAAIFQSLNPNDFETVDVLKDATSQALYGSRGAAGVIVVTTKKGAKNKTVVTYRGQMGMTGPGKQPFEMMNSAELLAFQEKLGVAGINNDLPGWVNSPLNPSYAAANATEQARRDRVIDSLSGININWKDEFMRRGKFSSHDINVSGGTGNTRFFLSAATYDEEGITIRSDLKRRTFRGSVEHATDKLTISLNTYAGFANYNIPEGDGDIGIYNAFAAAYLAVPYKSAYRANGTLDASADNVGAYAIAMRDGIDRTRNQIKANVVANINYQLYKGIYLGGQAGVDFTENNNKTIIRPGSFAASQYPFPIGAPVGGGTPGGSYSENFARQANYQTRAYVGYRHTFANKHAIDVTLNTEYIERRFKGFNMQGFGLNPKLPNTVATTPGTVANQLIPGIGGGNNRNTLLSYFGVGRYVYDGKYTFELTVRRDGSSVLPEKNRFQNFIAAGGNWNIMREDFAANWNKINTLRLRASYGQSANAENFPGISLYDAYSQGSYAGQPTLALATIRNPNADWEYTNQLNIGVDFGFFRDRLNGSLDVYNKITKGLFIDQRLSNMSGAGAIPVNAGKMGNKGVELSLNYDVLRNRDWTFNVGANLAYNKNEILDLGQVSEYILGEAIIREGLAFGSHYAVKWAGVDAGTGQPLYYTRDGKVTTTYNEETMSVAEFGTSNAPFIGGFNGTVSYKGISVAAFFTFQDGFTRGNNQDFFQLNHAFALQGFNMRKEMSTMWTKPGDVSNYQSPQTQVNFSSKLFQDASYLRFRNLTVAYNLPSNILGRQNIIKTARIYGQAQNLYTWTKWTGFDPEDSNNLATYEFPSPRTYTLGLEVSF